MSASGDLAQARFLIETAREAARVAGVEPAAWIIVLFGQLVTDVIETAPGQRTREELCEKCHETFDRLFDAYPREQGGER